MSEQYELLTEQPSQWIAASYIIPDIQKKEIKPFVLLALKELQGEPDSRMSNLTCMDRFAAVRQVVRHVARARTATKTPWHADDVRNFLEGLKFNSECVQEFTSLLCADQIYENITRHLRVKLGITSLQWRIDISLSQRSLAEKKYSEQQVKEIMRRDTYVILMLKLTDDSVRTYRMTVNKFHELRFVVASALKSMIVLEKRKCMRKD